MKHRHSARFVRPRHISALGLAFALALCGTPLSADQNIQIFTEAPEPRELGNILFPPRYRAVVLNNVQEQPEQPEVFGLLINFEFDSTNIVPESKGLLDSVGEMMQMERLAGEAIVVEGHTDAVGSAAYNQGLSERRAGAVQRYLQTAHGIDPSRLVVEGKGEAELHDRQRPANPVNRRVQFRAADAG